MHKKFKLQPKEEGYNFDLYWNRKFINHFFHVLIVIHILSRMALCVYVR